MCLDIPKIIGVSISPSINLDEGYYEIAEQTKAKLTFVDLAGIDRMIRTNTDVLKIVTASTPAKNKALRREIK